MIEQSHLRIIHALDATGTLTAAAVSLNLSQSTLSHKIRYLENKLEVRIWQRDGRNLRLTQAGELLLQTARQVLPLLEQTEQRLRAYGQGRAGLLRIGVECYPCYQWLTSVLGAFMQLEPEVEVDLAQRLQFSGLEGLLNHQLDVLITPDKESARGIAHKALTNYKLVLFVASHHPLAGRAWVMPRDFAELTLLSFPVAQQKLDVFTGFLIPARITPVRVRRIESIELMLELVMLGRGVAVLPDWLTIPKVQQDKIARVQLGRMGIHKQLFVALREQDATIAYMRKFIELGKDMANQRLRQASSA